jgi:hypothetical protein
MPRIAGATLATIAPAIRTPAQQIQRPQPRRVDVLDYLSAVVAEEACAIAPSRLLVTSHAPLCTRVSSD